MEANNKSWMLSVFSSARVLLSYTIDQLVRLGVGWVWMGLEGQESAYDKLKGVDTLALVKLLQKNGIRVLGSSIIGLENHSPENITGAIDYAVSHDSVFHQFMLYTPVPGTPLYEKHKQEGNLLSASEFPYADAHGQYRFNYRHPHFQDGEEEKFLLDAFRNDFKVNGPSLLRLIRVLLNGWQTYKDAPRRIRKRFAWEIFPVRSTYAGAVWAIKKWYREDKTMARKADELLKDIYSTFGWKTRLITPLFGCFAFYCLKKEEERLATGWSYEPSLFHEKNEAALSLTHIDSAKNMGECQTLRPLPTPAFE